MYRYFSNSIFLEILSGVIPLQKSPKSQVDIKGGGDPFLKSPNPARGGSSPLWTNSQVSSLFRLENFPMVDYAKGYQCLLWSTLKYDQVDLQTHELKLMTFCYATFYFYRSHWFSTLLKTKTIGSRITWSVLFWICMFVK